jgi:hypothetical protein
MAWPKLSWIILIALRRAALVAITLVRPDRLQSTIMAMMTAIIVLLHLWYHPYREASFNTLETISLIIHLFMALLLTSEEPPYSFATKVH